MKVFKFGGASVNSADAVRNMAQIVKNHLESQPLVVVVSAMGKTTNLLEKLVPCDNGAPASCRQELRQQLEDYHLDIAKSLIPNDGTLVTKVLDLLHQLDTTIHSLKQSSLPDHKGTALSTAEIKSDLAKNQTIKQPHLHLIYGCVNDKDFRHILQLLTSQLSTFHFSLSIYFTQPSVPRRLPVADLAAAAHEMGIDGPAFDTVQEAIAAARAAADPEDLVLVTGSIFLVADALTTN